MRGRFLPDLAIPPVLSLVVPFGLNRLVALVPAILVSFPQTGDETVHGHPYSM